MMMCLQNNIKEYGQSILPQCPHGNGKFAREKFLMGRGCLRSDFDHSDLLQS